MRRKYPYTLFIGDGDGNSASHRHCGGGHGTAIVTDPAVTGTAVTDPTVTGTAVTDTAGVTDTANVTETADVSDATDISVSSVACSGSHRLYSLSHIGYCHGHQHRCSPKILRSR